MIVQGVIASTGGASTPPPYNGTEFFWAGDNDAWSALGGYQSNSGFSNPAPANPVYAYPDGSYTGKTRNFTGSEWMSSMNLGGYPNAWSTNAIAINFWFYPTAAGVQLLSECDYPDVTLSYHYSMLEIDNGGYVKARFYNGTYPTSAAVSSTTVILNQWNHIYFAEDEQGGHTLELNGVGTGVQNAVYIRLKPPNGSEYFIIGDSDTSNQGSSGRFQGKIGYLTIADYVNGSTFVATKNRFRTTLTSGTALTFSGSGQDVQVTDARTDWDLGNAWTIEWWEKMDSDAANFCGVMSQDSNDGGVPNYTGPLGFDIYHANGAIQMFNGRWTFAEPTRGQWNHVAIQKNGAAVTPYINGTAVGLVGFTDPTRTLANSSLDLIIGLRSPNGVTPGYSQWFKGQLANIRISNVARYADISAFQAPVTVVVDANTLLSLDGSSSGDGMFIDETARHTITNNSATEVAIT